MGERLIFDGDCAFCTSSANWIARRLPPSAGVVPWQRVDLESVGLTAADVRTAAYWVDHEGRTFRGSRAVGQALRECRAPWPIVAWLCLVPPTSWVAAAVYAVIARYRWRLPGGTPACRVN